MSGGYFWILKDTGHKTLDSRLKGHGMPCPYTRYSSLVTIMSCGIFCLLLFALSTNAFPAEESQDDPDSQQVDSGRTVSISTGSGGKVTWLLGKNLGTAHGDAVVEYEDVTLKADHIWADLDAEVVEAQGNVRMEMKDQTITADHMLFDLKSKKRNNERWFEL